MIDALLINLPIQTYKSKVAVSNFDFCPSIGLMSLYSALKFNGYSVEIIDLILNPMKKTEFIQKVCELRPKMLGISAYTENINIAIRLATSIKEVLPDIRIALGGAHVTLSLKEFSASNAVDFAIMGEGESSILELMTAISTEEKLIRYDDIDGLAFRRNNEVFVNNQRKFITALDVLPLPARDYYGLDMFKGNRWVIVSTSRGCPNGCIYCAAQTISGKKYRVRDIENVYLEIVMLQKEIKEDILITIIDDSFTVLKNRVSKFLDLIEDYNANFLWECESIVRHMDENLLKRMKKNNLISIQFGIESGNQQVLDRIRKGINLLYAEDIIRKARELGIITYASFIFGHYCDTEETAQDTIDFMKKLVTKYNVNVVASYNTPFPGTYQYEHAQELGMKFISDDFKMYTLLAPIVETENFTVKDQINWMHKSSTF